MKIAETQAPLLPTENEDVKSKSPSNKAKKKIRNSLAITPNKSYTNCYVINYENGGFVIIAGDNRLNPVLAYSDDNSFPINEKNYPSGLADWLCNMNEEIIGIKGKKIIQS